MKFTPTNQSFSSDSCRDSRFRQIVVEAINTNYPTYFSFVFDSLNSLPKSATSDHFALLQPLQNVQK